MHPELHNHPVQKLLNDLQFQPCERYVIYNNLPIGLGGQISGRLLVLKVAMALGRKAVFKHLSDPPYTQVFAPQCSHVPAESLVPADKKLSLADKLDSYPVIQFSPDDFTKDHHEWINHVEELIRQKLQLPTMPALEIDGAILEWMTPTKGVAQFVSDSKARLGIGPKTLGVHYRRGDKSVETAYVPASEINKAIAGLHAHHSFDSIYLASDSPAAPDDIIAPAGVEMIFDYEEKRYNNANHKMLMDRPALAEQETLTAFKNYEILSRCYGLVGQDNAHFATLGAARIQQRIKRRDTVTLINGRIAEKNSPAISYAFKVNSYIRSIGRKLLPFLTAKAKMERLQKKMLK